MAAFLLLAAPKVNASAASKKPGAVTGFTAKSDYDDCDGGIRLSWKNVRHAKYYEVYWKKSKNGKFKKYTTTSNLSCNLDIGSYFQANKTYAFKVRAINGKKTGKFSPVKSAKAVLGRPSTSLSLESENNVSVGTHFIYHSDNANLKGFELYRSSSKNGKYTKIKTFKKKHSSDDVFGYNSDYDYTDANLLPGEYFYKVRNYAKIKGKKVYSKFSSVESIIVPKKVEITMDNWMQYYELSPLDCELRVDKNSFGEVTDSYIDYWKDLQLKSKYHLDDRYDEDSSVAVELEYTENHRECAIDWNTGKITPGAIVPYHDDYEEKDIYTETHTKMDTITSSLTLSSDTIRKKYLEEPSKTTAWIVDDINMKRIKGTIYLDKW